MLTMYIKLGSLVVSLDEEVMCSSCSLQNMRANRLEMATPRNGRFFADYTLDTCSIMVRLPARLGRGCLGSKCAPERGEPTPLFQARGLAPTKLLRKHGIYAVKSSQRCYA